MFQYFIANLIIILDKQEETWRLNTVFLVDGAKYYTSKSNLKFIEKQQINYIISAPYSYNVASIELVFADLKKKIRILKTWDYQRSKYTNN